MATTKSDIAPDKRGRKRGGRWILLALVAALALAGVTRLEAFRSWSLGRKSLEELQATANADKSDVLAWSLYADKLRLAEKGEVAAAAYEQAVAALPEGSNPRDLLAEAAHTVARFGTEEQAASLVERAVKAAPDDPRTLIAQGVLAMRGKDYAGAQGFFQKAVKAAPENGEAWDRLGTSFLALGKPGDAEEPLRRAVRLRPNDAAVHADLGEALAQQSRFRDARDEYAAAARLAPASPDYAAQYAMAAASAARTDEDYEMASSLLVAALQASPDDAGLHLNLAGLQMRFARMEEARRTYEAVVGRMPDHSDAWFNLSTVYMRLGDKASAGFARARFQDILDRQTAVVELTKKTLMRPRDADLFAALSEALRKAGDDRGAYRALQAAVELAPGNTQYRARLEAAQHAFSGAGPSMRRR